MRETERRETTGARGRGEREWGRFMVLCELVLDQWSFKAYKSAAASTGFVLSSILSARCTRRGARTSESRLLPGSMSLVDLSRSLLRIATGSASLFLSRSRALFRNPSIDPTRAGGRSGGRAAILRERSNASAIVVIKAFIARDYDLNVSRRR